MAEDLIILGAGGTGREVAEAVEDINSLGRQWNLIGFLDDDEQKHGKEYNGHPVLGAIRAAPDYPSCRFVFVLGNHRNLKLTKRLEERLQIEPCRFATLLHPTARVSRHAEIEAGSIVLANCVVAPNAKIGRHVLVHFSAHIAHDCVLEDYSVIGPNAVLAGGVRVGQGAYIGANASIVQKTRIGAWSCVGIGAVVLSHVQPGCTVFGNPARLLRNRCDR